MARDDGQGTLDPDMPPTQHRSGEWSEVKEIVDAAVRDAVKKALDGDSSILKGVDYDVENGKRDMQRLVTELKSAMVASSSELHQRLMERMDEAHSSLRTMVREEVQSVRSQVATIEVSIGQINQALHQGDTAFAVIDTKVKVLQGELDRVRDTPLTPQRAIKALEPGTEKHSKPSEPALSKSPLLAVILAAVFAAVGTSVGGWAMNLFERGAKDVVKDVVKDERPDHANSPKPTTASP